MYPIKRGESIYIVWESESETTINVYKVLSDSPQEFIRTLTIKKSEYRKGD